MNSALPAASNAQTPSAETVTPSAETHPYAPAASTVMPYNNMPYFYDPYYYNNSYN